MVTLLDTRSLLRPARSWRNCVFFVPLSFLFFQQGASFWDPSSVSDCFNICSISCLTQNKRRKKIECSAINRNILNRWSHAASSFLLTRLGIKGSTRSSFLSFVFSLTLFSTTITRKSTWVPHVRRWLHFTKGGDVGKLPLKSSAIEIALSAIEKQPSLSYASPNAIVLVSKYEVQSFVMPNRNWI